MNEMNVSRPATAAEIIAQVRPLLHRAQVLQRTRVQWVAATLQDLRAEINDVGPVLRRRWRNMPGTFPAGFWSQLRQGLPAPVSPEDLGAVIVLLKPPADMTEEDPDQPGQVRLRASFREDIRAAFEEVLRVTLTFAELRALHAVELAALAALPAEPLPPPADGAILPDSIQGCLHQGRQWLEQASGEGELIAAWQRQARAQLQERQRWFDDQHQFQAYAWFLRSTLDLLFQELRGKYQSADGRGLPYLPVGQGYRLFFELRLSDSCVLNLPRGFQEVKRETLVQEVSQWIEATGPAVAQLRDQERAWQEQQAAQGREQQARANKAAERALFQAEREKMEARA